MPLGLPTLIERPSVRESVELCRALSLDFVELNNNFPKTEAHALKGGELEALSRDEGVAFTLHLDERLDPCDFNPLLRRAALETVRRACGLAARAGMKRITAHMSDGVYITLPDRKPFLYQVYLDEYLERLALLRETVERELPCGCLFCLENTAWREFHRRGIDALLESSAFALCWDIGHDYAAGGRDRPFLMEREGRIAHMHLHDAKRGQNHLAPGEGQMDMEQRARYAWDRNLSCVLEVKTVEALTRAATWARSARERMAAGE